MRGGKFGILILAALAAAPAISAPTTPGRPSSEIVRDPNAAADADLQLYGEWLGRVTQIEDPVQQQLMGLQSAWRQGMSRQPQEGIAQLRAYIQNALVVIDAADAEVARVDVPALSHLQLPEDLLPAGLISQVRQFNREIRTAIASYLPLLDSFGRPREAEAAGMRLIANLRIVFQSQLVMLRAGQAATPSSYVAWDVAGFQIDFVRAAERIFRTFDPVHPSPDARLPADLIAIADDVDAGVLRAEQKLAASLERVDNAVIESEQQADANRVALLRRSRGAIALNRDYFPVARQLSAFLRQAAAAMQGRVLTSALITRLFAPMQPIRAGFDDVAIRQNRALADGP